MHRNHIHKLISVLLLCVAFSGCNDHPKTEPTVGVSLHSELGGSAEGYERACGPRQFSFPADHGAHPSFRNEWWYITGNLEDASGSRFGFHVTFFRIANQPLTPDNNSNNTNPSNWNSREFYMAHFAVTAADLNTNNEPEKTISFERFSRAAAGLSGAKINSTPVQQEPLVRVWLDDWHLHANKIDNELVWQLSIKEGDYAIQMNLYPQKPVVLQGQEGYSQKSADPCNASYYYSLPRLKAEGQVTVATEQYDVNGTAWLDREWSSSALSDDQTGWDWFALQLDDGRDIMLYRLRKSDGSADPYSYAVEMDQQGNKQNIPMNQISIDIEQWWQSPSGARYPVAGRIHRKDTNETLVFTPLKANQELNLTIRYWEGAINLSNADGKQIGRGYLELTGY